jgi:formylglycine-generating enzyme required for sulfatase activity
MSRIFISYSSKDYRHFVNQFVKRLDSKVYSGEVWIDKKLTGGQDWWATILSQIQKCEIFVYVISKSSLNSRYCQAEYHYAVQLNKKILPVIIQKGIVLPEYISKWQVVEFFHGANNIDAFEDFYAAIKNLDSIPNEPLPVPLPSHPTEPPIPFDELPGIFRWLRERLPEVALTIGVTVVAGIIIGEGRFAPPPTSTYTNTPTPDLDTPTATYSPAPDTPISPIGITPTTPIPPTPDGTATEVADALDRARNFTGTNIDWKTLYPNGFSQTFNGVEMVLVPKGCFMMGSNDGDSDEQPMHEQCFHAPFWIDKYEVTNVQFGSVGCEDWSSEPNQPRNCVTWFEARDYCAGRDARLPTEREWEYAARGVSNWVYPWGNNFATKNAVFDDNSGGKPAVVGSRPGGVAWIGAQDLSGNIWEWTSSWYGDYPYAVNDGREGIEDSNNNYIYRVLRGGSFVGSTDLLQTANRFRNNPDVANYYRGFRCSSSIK